MQINTDRDLVNWRGQPYDPMQDPIAPEIIEAYEAAQEQRRSTHECYRAAIDVWRRAYPEHTREYASKQAIEVVLRAKVSLRVDE